MKVRILPRGNGAALLLTGEMLFNAELTASVIEAVRDHLSRIELPQRTPCIDGSAYWSGEDA